MSDGASFESNATEVAALLRNREPLARALAESFEELRQIAQKTAEEGLDGGTGIAVRSIFSDANVAGMKVGTMLPRARAMSIENGRPSGVPPEQILAQIIRWKDSVGISDPGIVVAQGISRRGVKGRFFMQATREKVAQELPRHMAKTKTRLRATWGDQ